MDAVGLGCPSMGGMVVVVEQQGVRVGVRAVGETTPFPLGASSPLFC